MTKSRLNKFLQAINKAKKEKLSKPKFPGLLCFVLFCFSNHSDCVIKNNGGKNWLSFSPGTGGTPKVSMVLK